MKNDEFKQSALFRCWRAACLLTFFLPIIAVIAGCSGNKTNQSRSVSDSGVVEVAQPDSIMEPDSILPGRRQLDDVTVGPWSLKTTTAANGITIVRDKYSYPDSSVFVTVTYGKQPVIVNKEISATDITGHVGVYLTGYGGIGWSSDSALYVRFGCYMPDSDVGYSSYYQIQKNGTTDVIQIDDEYGVDGHHVIANLMALYFGERSAGVPVTGMKPLLEEYCTEHVVEELCDSTVILESPLTDYKLAHRTVYVDCMEDLVLTEKRSTFMAKWEMPDSTIERKYFEVIFPDNKISKISNDTISCAATFAVDSVSVDSVGWL